MAISSTTSTTGTTSTTSSRVSGLATGMDTDALVKALTTATQTKIDKIKQQKQALLWKQEAYRTVSKSVTDFKTKYFQSWSSSSVLNTGFFKQMAVTSSTPATATATANADASEGDIVINDITSLATATKITSNSGTVKDTSKPLSELFPTVIEPISFTINDVSFSFTKDQSLAQVMSAVNSSAAGVKMTSSGISGKMSLTAKTTGASTNIVTADIDGSNFMATMFGDSTTVQGTDAELTINGEAYTNSSNTFTLDGVKYNLLGTTTNSVTLKTALNVDSIVTGIKAFVDSYNTLIGDVNTKLGEERNRDYQPLTEAQETAMSEANITKWNEKAKSGWLRNDATLQKMVTGMRTALFSDVKQVDSESGLGINLSDIGITTGAYTDGGKLEVDENALRTALQTRPDAVANLFTQKSSTDFSSTLTSSEKSKRTGETGLGWRLSEIIDANVRTTRDTAGKKGQLLEIAGITGDVSEYKNSIYTQLTNMDTSLKTQNTRLTAQEDRLYKKFSAMESAINKMNQQSTWLTQQTSSSTN